MKRNLGWLIFVCTILFGFGWVGCNSEDNIQSGSEKNFKVQYEFGEPGHFSYAPSAIEGKHGIRYVFVCHNKEPYLIKDNIFVYKGIPTDEGYKWQPGRKVLGPSEKGWDHVHTCDPDVREVSFTYKGEHYNWIMFYLGVDQWDNNHNQIGLAFSKNIEGPYEKYEGNPLVTFSDTTQWGVGQSTTVVLDSSTVRLFYRKSPGSLRQREIVFKESGIIEMGEEQEVTHLYANTYIAYTDSNRYAVSETRRDQSKEIPTWVGNHLRIAKQQRSAKFASTEDSWEEIGLVGPSETGFPRNHNPGFLTDSKGYLLSEDELKVYFTVSETGENWIWSYDLYSVTINLDK